MKYFPEFSDVLIVDEQGRAEYCRMGDMDFFEVDYRKVRGTTVLQWYQNRTVEESSVMNAVRNGVESFDVVDILTTKSGKVIRQISNTYCIMHKGKVVGAIELAIYDPEKDVLNPGRGKENRDILDIHRLDEADFVGKTDAIKGIKNKFTKIRDIEASILITGETGSGKETLARVIHNTGNRRKHPFVYVNCGALPEPLLESILFGTEKGAYTDAETRSGLFEEANRGILFLDELDSMPLSVQGKLLKAIEEKRIRKVGGSKDINVDVRIIASCNSGVRDLICGDKIRPDLFFRLSAIQISLPPLAERKEDIPEIAEYFLGHFNRRFNRNVRGFDPEVFEKFMAYDWPGNVRELRNTIEGAFHTAKGDTILLRDVAERFNADDSGERSREKLWQAFRESGMNISDFIRRFEEDEISRAMKEAGGDLDAASDLLGMQKATLRSRLDRNQ